MKTSELAKEIIKESKTYLGLNDIKIFKTTLLSGEIGIGISIGDETAKFSKSEVQDVIRKFKVVL
jgi:hypothetical protein